MSQIVQSQTRFVKRGGKLYGVLSLRDKDGQRIQVLTPTHSKYSDGQVRAKLNQQREKYGIPASKNESAGKRHEVGGFLGDLVDGAGSVVKKGAGAVKKGAGAIYQAHKKGTQVAYAASKNPMVQAAVASTVPGGVGIVAGIKAVHLVEKAKAGDKPSLEQISQIAGSAGGGNQTAAKALEALKVANQGLKAAELVTKAKAGDAAAKAQLAALNKAAASGNKTAGDAFGIAKAINGKMQAVADAMKSNPGAMMAVQQQADPAVAAMKPHPAEEWKKWGLKDPAAGLE